MANDRHGDPIVVGNVYGVAGKVRRVDTDSVLIIVGQDGHEMAVRVAASEIVPVPATKTVSGANVSISSAEWAGSLVGSGVKSAQELADWIDANVVVSGGGG